MTFLFFISGAAGLMFEVVWFHRCGLAFGNSVWSTSLVLSSFMGGIAVGNGIVGRLGPRVATLRMYAALETTIAVAGLAVALGLPAISPAVATIADPVSTPLWLVNVARLVMAFATLFIPSTAIGATLPVLVGALARDRDDFGRILGRLYGWNTLGAVAGVVTAELVLVNRVGVMGTAWTAAFLDLAVAAGALAVGRHVVQTFKSARSARDAGLSSSSAPQAGLKACTTSHLAPQATRTTSHLAPLAGLEAWTTSDLALLRVAGLLGCAFLAGAVLLSLEVIWFRFLTMYVLATTMAVSLMLASVLAAIALGALAASAWLARRRDAIDHAPVVALAAGCATAVTYLAFQWLTGGTQVGEWYRVLWMACALTAPTSVLSGILFTLLGAALEHDVAVPARAAAWLTLANTAGAMVGPLIAAFVLLPLLGMERTLFASAATYAVVALLAVRHPVGGLAQMRSPLAVAGALALAVTLVRFPFGLMRDRYFARAAQPYAADGSTIVATREGASETIFLMQQSWQGRPVYSRLVTNGFSMTGTTVPAMRYMRYFAYWPMLLHEAPLRRALVICYGVGVTAGAVLDLPALETLDVVELSRDVVAASDLVYAGGRHPLRDPRARLHIEDGRYFLQASRDRFDLITAEPPPPRTPGAVNIYTREYFRLIHDRLAEGGITTYWLPVARPDPGTDVNTIVRAFCDVFDDCSLWNGTPFDLMLVGTRHASGQVPLASFARAWNAPGIAARLREVGFEQPEQVGATFLADAPYLRALTANTPPLTDDFPERLRPAAERLSLSDPRYRSDPAALRIYQQLLDTERARQLFESSTFIRRLWPAPLIDATGPLFGPQRILNRVLLEGPNPLRDIDDLHTLLTTTSLRTLPLWLLGSDDVKERIAEGSSERSGATEYMRGLRALTTRDYLRAAAHFSEAERRGLDGTSLRPLLVYSLCLAGDADGARQLARGLTARDADERHFRSWLQATFGV